MSEWVLLLRHEREGLTPIVLQLKLSPSTNGNTYTCPLSHHPPEAWTHLCLLHERAKKSAETSHQKCDRQSLPVIGAEAGGTTNRGLASQTRSNGDLVKRRPLMNSAKLIAEMLRNRFSSFQSKVVDAFPTTACRSMLIVPRTDLGTPFLARGKKKKKVSSRAAAPSSRAESDS